MPKSSHPDAAAEGRTGRKGSGINRIAVLAAAALCSLAAVSPALGSGRFSAPTIRFESASRANYTAANRPASAIRLVVIHVTESSAIGAITWFRNPKAQASANYVVGKSGGITEMVPDSDIAWQAGNWAINRESIGVEHEGYTYVPNSFTDAEYRASAQLVASEMRHYVLPIDRRHIIGHYEVPDPNHPGLFGGFAHHTDPGPHWDWTRYMAYVTSYARGNVPALHIQRTAPASAGKAAKPKQITAKVSQSGKVTVSSGLSNGETVEGFVRWQASVDNATVQRVDFLVDGRVRSSATSPPYSFGGSTGWDTTGETNGPHTLTVRVVTKDGSTVGQSVTVDVANSPFEVAPVGVQNGQVVSGKVRWEASPSGATPDHVDFLVDGKLANTEKEAPYVYGGDGGVLDTTALANGAHSLVMRAVAVDGRVAEADLSIVVNNVAATPPPRPRPTGDLTHIGSGGVWDGGTFTGLVRWEGQITGPRPARVEFWIDGHWRWTDTSPPYVFNGDNGRWDTSQETAGTHVLEVKAIGRDGSQLDSKTVTVTVQSSVSLSSTSPAAPVTMGVTSSISDTSTVHGPVVWTATVTGATPDHVDFLIDGRLRHTERTAPYEFGTWDTTQEANGQHVLTVRAVARDGTTATTSANVLVANVVVPLAIDTQTIDGGQTLTASVDWTVTTTGPTPDKVELWIDGTRAATVRAAPYTYRWDTTRASNGSHQLVVKAYAGTQVVQATESVTVANTIVPLVIASQSLTDGQTVLGSVDWNVTTTGPTVDKVEFWVDGALAATDRTVPFSYRLATASLANGAHQLLVKAYAGAQTVQASERVTVANPPAPTIASQTIADGATVSDRVSWQVVVSGTTPDRVEFWIDGTRRWTENGAPYVFNGDGSTWNTAAETDGAHTLVVKAIAGAQTSTATLHVTVANAATPPASPPPPSTTPPASTSPPVTTPPLAIATDSIADGATLTGPVSWSITTTGSAKRIELQINGSTVYTTRSSSTSVTLDTRKLPNGTYTLGERVVGTDGTTVSASHQVTVANP